MIKVNRKLTNKTKNRFCSQNNNSMGKAKIMTTIRMFLIQNRAKTAEIFPNERNWTNRYQNGKFILINNNKNKMKKESGPKSSKHEDHLTE